MAIVTGAAGFLGASHCLHLAREGAKVIVTDVVDGRETVERIHEAGGEAVFHHLDVTDWEQARAVVAATVKAFGRLDILVNNAALTQGVMKPWTEYSPEEWDKHLAVDLKGMFVCARAAFPVMKEQRNGNIINISSDTVLAGFPNVLPYVSAKAGVIGFTRSLATEVGEFGINVNAIIVGFFPHSFPGIPASAMEQITEQVVGRQALKRPGRPEDLSPVVVFLASDDARWITGQAIAVDGGGNRTGG